VISGSATTYASGLRNASGLAFDTSGRLWAVVNQRDDIGPTQEVTDNLPPDELDLIRSGGEYGWPHCYPDPKIAKRDPNPEYARADCSGTVPASLDFQAHSAPLGIVYYDATPFPAAYRGGALGVQGVEILVEAFLGGLARVNGTTDAGAGRHGLRLRNAAHGRSSGPRWKKAKPLRCWPVMAWATALSER